MSARAAVTVIFALNGLLYGTWAARLPAVSERLDLSAGELGFALAFIAGGALVAMPIAGRAAARFGSSRATTVAIMALCVSTALAPAAPSLAALCVGCALMGASGGGLDVSMNAHGVTVEREVGRPILSSFHAAFSLGGLGGALLGAGGAAAGIDVRVELAALGALSAVLAAVATRRLLPASADVRTASVATGAAVAAPGGDGETAADRAAVSGTPSSHRRGPDRRLALLGVLAFCCLLCEGAAADWSAVYVDRSLSASAAVGGLAFAAFSVTMVAGRLVGDRLTERFGSAALVRRGSIVAAVGLATALVLGTPAAALVGFACLGAGLSIVIPQVFRAAAGSTEVGGSGPALAAVTTIGYTGFLAGPPLIGAVAELTSLPLALGLLPLLTVAIAVLAPLTRTPSVVPAAQPA